VQAVLPEIRFYLLTVLRLRICRVFRLVINALRAVEKKIENNRPDSRFSAICGHALAAVLIQLIFWVILMQRGIKLLRPFAVGLNDWSYDFFYRAFASQAKLDQFSIHLFSIAALITVVCFAF
jgi:hypothetical protein